MSSPTHYGAYNFMVAIDGVPVAEFAECILPTATIEVIEYREGNELTNNIHKLPGLLTYGNLILKRGIPCPPTQLAMWDWFSSFAAGAQALKTVTVTLLDAKKDPVMKWSFANCWPVRYESPVLDGQTSALAIETVEVAVEGMQITG